MSAATGTLRPIGSRVTVRQVAQPDQVRHGLAIAPAGETPSPFAVVLAVGRQCQAGLKVGDLVVMKSWGGYEVDADGERFITLDESDVVARVE